MAVLYGGPSIDDICRITLVFDRMKKDSLVGCRVDDKGQRDEEFLSKVVPEHLFNMFCQKFAVLFRKTTFSFHYRKGSP